MPVVIWNVQRACQTFPDWVSITVFVLPYFPTGPRTSDTARIISETVFHDADVTRGWKKSFYTLDPDLASTVSHKVSVDSCYLALGKQIVQKICCTAKSSVEIHQLVLFDGPRMLQTLFIVHHVPSCSLYTMYMTLCTFPTFSFLRHGKVTLVFKILSLILGAS